MNVRYENIFPWNCPQDFFLGGGIFSYNGTIWNKFSWWGVFYVRLFFHGGIFHEKKEFSIENEPDSPTLFKNDQKLNKKQDFSIYRK
jgi:hypothetical protein